MFNDLSIVSTAVSSFNNAALFSPYFFVVALFCAPLYYMVWLYGRDILTKLKWNSNIGTKIGFWSVLFLTGWLMIFGGNYAAIRDGISLLPTLISVVLFTSMIYIVQQSKSLNYLQIFANPKIKWSAFFTLVLLAVASAKPNLYGILLQLSAVFCGIIVGSRLYKNISALPMSTIIFGTMTGLILMQPEYFRFGQLGNLTFVHLLGILATGFLAITTLATKYTNARAKIYQSAYIKLKWLCRIVGALALILFILTESVPVFVGLIAVCGISEMLTIYHSKKSAKNLTDTAWAMMLVCFGILIICPIISCLGILYMKQTHEIARTKDFCDLL